MPVDSALNTAALSPDRTPGAQNSNCGPDIPSRERDRQHQDQDNSRQPLHTSRDKHANVLSTANPRSSTKRPGEANSQPMRDSSTPVKMQQQQQQHRGAPKDSRPPAPRNPSPRDDPSNRGRDRAIPDRDRTRDRSPRDRDRGNLGPSDRPDSRHRDRDLQDSRDRSNSRHDLRSDPDRNISSQNDSRSTAAAAAGSNRKDADRGSTVGRRPAPAAAAPAREQQRRQRSRSPPPRAQQQQQQQRRRSSEPGYRRDLNPPPRQRQQQQQQPGRPLVSSPPGRSAAAAAAPSPRQQQQQPPSALMVPSNSAAAAALSPAAAAAPGSNAFEMLERFLGRQAALQEVLVPTAGNISTVFITKDDFLEFLTWQEWIKGHLGISLQLLAGTYVAVPATGMEPSSSREAVEAERAVPVRIRQVKGVDTNLAIKGPEQARVLLVGGGAVEASQLGEQALLEIPDHEALCCELASLQLQEYAPKLRLYEIAHTVWRLRLCSGLEETIKRWKQDQAELKAEGHDAEFIASAEQQAFEGIRLRIQQLPRASYMAEVVEYVDFRTDDPAVLQQQLQDAEVRWQQYVQQQRQRMHLQQPGQLVLPPGLAPQQQQQQQQPQQVTVVYLPPPQAQQPVPQLQVGNAYLNRPAAAACWQQPLPAPIGAAAGPGFNSSSSGLNPLNPLNPDPAGPIAQGFVEVDDPEFYDDPTGLGGLSPLPENPSTRAPQTLAPNPSLLQPHGSLGFGMGSSGGVGNRVQDPAGGPRDLGIGSSMTQQQQQQQQWDGRGPALQPYMIKYNGGDRSLPASGNHTSGLPAAAAAADPAPPQQQQQQQNSYAYWVEQGDIAAAETDPRMRRAQAHMAAVNATHMPPAAAAAYDAPMGRGYVPGPNDLYQQQHQQSILRGPSSVFERLGPVNPSDAALDPAAAAAAAAGSSKHRDSSRDRESRKRDRKDRDRSPAVRDRDRDRDRDAKSAAADRHRSRSRERKSSKEKSKRHSSPDKPRDSKSKDRSKSSRDKDRAAAAGSSKSDRRDKVAAAAAAVREPSPDIKEVLHRLVVGAKQLPAGMEPATSRIRAYSPSRDRREVDQIDRSRPRPRSSSRDRPRAAGRGRSHSPGWRSEKRYRTSDDRGDDLDHAAAAAAAAAASSGSRGSRSPRHIEAVRARFSSRLEGADGIFDSLQEELQQQALHAPGPPRSPDQIIKGWLHRLANMKHQGRDRGDGYFHLQYLRAHLPVPEAALQAWGTVYNFLHNHPAVIFNPGTKMVTVDDAVDIDAVSALPPGAAWGSDDRTGFRPPSRQEGPPGFNPQPPPRPGQGLAALRVPEPPGPGSRNLTPTGNGYNTNYSPGSAAAAIAIAELQQDTDAFVEELQKALDAAPDGYVHPAQGYRLLPPGLAEKVRAGQPIDLLKFVQDNVPDVEVVSKPGISGFVMERRPEGKVWHRPPVCAYWQPDRWSSCKKGARCDYRHDVLPAAL